MKQSIIKLVKLLRTKRLVMKLIIISLTVLAGFNIFFMLDYFWYKGLRTSHYLFMASGMGIALFGWSCWPKKAKLIPFTSARPMTKEDAEVLNNIYK